MERFYKYNENYLDNIIVSCDSVSEGQYAVLLNGEASAIDGAIAKTYLAKRIPKMLRNNLDTVAASLVGTAIRLISLRMLYPFSGASSSSNKQPGRRKDIMM